MMQKCPHVPAEQCSNRVLITDLKACTKTRDLERGKHVHAEAIRCGRDSDVYVVSALMNMYGKCGRMMDAQQVFDTMKHPDVVSFNVLIMGYADNGQCFTALDFFTRLKTEGIAPNSITFIAALKACKGGASGWADWGKAIHNLTVESGCNSDIFVQNSLIDTYAKCGSMVDAWLVFEKMKHTDVVSWTALIQGYADSGEASTALDLFTRMRSEGLVSDFLTFVAVLKACICLTVNRCFVCKLVHNLAVETGCNSNNYVQNTLIEIYARSGSMKEARQVFDSMEQPDLVSWNVLILGYADSGEGFTALDLFTRMRIEGPAPDSLNFVAVLKSCTSCAHGWAQCTYWGKAIHNLTVENGCDSNTYVQNSLIDMYAKTNNMEESRQVFDGIKRPEVVAWNALLLGYVENGQGVTSLDLFTNMKREGPAPSSITLAIILKACCLVGALEFGRTIHAEFLDCNDLNVILVTCLVDFYAKCGSLVEAQRIFESYVQITDYITWNALLTGFSSCGDYESVFRIFQRMQDAGLQPNYVTFISILNCCTHVGLVEEGMKCFDAMSTKYGINPAVEHYTCMIDIFGRSNKLDEAMALLGAMPCSPDDVSWRTILSACRRWKNVKIGRLAFQSLTNFNSANLSAYVLMGQIYGSRGMFQEQEMVIKMKEK